MIAVWTLLAHFIVNVMGRGIKLDWMVSLALVCYVTVISTITLHVQCPWNCLDVPNTTTCVLWCNNPCISHIYSNEGYACTKNMCSQTLQVYC